MSEQTPSRTEKEPATDTDGDSDSDRSSGVGDDLGHRP